MAWCGPGGYYADDSFCESTVRMAPFLRDVKGATGPPSVPVGDAVQDSNAHDDILLSRAEYSGETGELVLYFDDPIFPFSIYVSRVTILHDKCDGIALSVSEFGGRVSLDRQYVTFNLDDGNRQALPGMTNPRIHLASGAFADDATRTENAPGDVPLLVTGVDSPPRADQQQGVVRTASCTLTYGLVEPPSAVLDEVDYGADFVAEHSEVVRQAIRDGFAAWTKLNPGMAFEEVDSGQPDIVIRWIEFAGEHIGYACVDCLRAGAIIELALEQPDCRGNQVAYGPGMIRNVLAHEFGHNLGLGHADDKDHLMSGSTPPPEPGRFNDLGYNIPERVSEYLVGAKPLVERYDKLYDEYRNSNSVSHRNALVGPINSLADRLNCMYNVSDP